MKWVNGWKLRKTAAGSFHLIRKGERVMSKEPNEAILVLEIENARLREALGEALELIGLLASLARGVGALGPKDGKRVEEVSGKIRGELGELPERGGRG